jgi:hypothetical protein
VHRAVHVERRTLSIRASQVPLSSSYSEDVADFEFLAIDDDLAVSRLEPCREVATTSTG